MDRKFLCMAAFAAMTLGLTSCSDDDDVEKAEEVVDFPVVGTINLSGAYNVYSHGAQGWIKEDKVGLFVLSDGVAQSNLSYESSKVATAQTFPMGDVEMTMYDKPFVTEDTPLKPTSTEVAGFKKGEHTLYAYVPFNTASKDYTAVVLPNLTTQELYETEMPNMPNRKYGFDVASAKVSTFSSATVSLGEFEPLFSQITYPSPKFGMDFDGKKVSKVVVSCDKAIAYEEGATINLATKEIKGTPVKEITMNLNDKTAKYNSRYDNVSLGTTLCFMVAVPFETAKDYEFTFTFTVEGKEYAVKGKPNANGSKKNNLNMNGIPTVGE